MRTFSADELATAAKHIAFEIHHFRCYAVLKNDQRLRSVSPAASQAVGYALLLHMRVLIDFFFTKPELDDCHVVHFRVLPGFTAAFPPDIHKRTQQTAEVLEHLNKLLAHFTANRWEDRRPDWSVYDKYTPIIENLATRFEGALQGDAKAGYDKGRTLWQHHSQHVNLPAPPVNL